MKEREKEGTAEDGTHPPNGGASTTSKRPRWLVEDEEDSSMEEDHVMKVKPSKKAKVGENGYAKGTSPKSAKKAKANGMTPVKVESPKKAATPKKKVTPKKAATSPKRISSPPKPSHKKKPANGGKVNSSSKKSKLESQTGKTKGGDDSGSSPKKRLKEELAALADDAVPNYSGVYREKGRYAAQVVHKGKLVHLGLHDKAVAAARAYDEGLKKLKADGEPNFQPVKERAKRGSVS